MKAAVLIDGGHLRTLCRQAGHKYNPEFIEKVAHACVQADEFLLRILYYDCAPFVGSAKLPVSGQKHEFKGSDWLLDELARRNLVAVRRGVLKFRGFKPKHIPINGGPPKDEDFKPDFEQKGVDMRIGLDIATFSSSRAVERIILVTGDTDCIPAMKHGRKAGLQVILARFPDQTIAKELLWHADLDRPVAWPVTPSKGTGKQTQVTK